MAAFARPTVASLPWLLCLLMRQGNRYEDVCIEAGEADRSEDHPPIELEEMRVEPARWDGPWDSDDDPMD